MSEAVTVAHPESIPGARETFDAAPDSVDKYLKINQTGAAASATPSNMAMGERANASGFIGIAFGVGSRSTGNYGVALGNNSVASDNAVALGGSAQATNARSVALGSGSITDKDNTVSVGALSQRRAIRFLADGELAASSHEAITGRQLFATNELVGANAAAIARNTENITVNATHINELSQQVSDGSLGLVRQDAASRTLTVGAQTNGTRVNLEGTQGLRRLSGLSKGQEAADAATFGQLEAALQDPLLARYDSAGRTALTLNPGGKATRLGNVADGTSPGEAVNKGQLESAVAPLSTQIDSVSQSIGEILQLATDTDAVAVKYDAANKAKVTFNTKGNGTVLSKVLPGEKDDDAVNKAQLDTAIAPITQKLSDALVYSNKAHTLVTLNPDQDAARLSNLAEGTSEKDAVNFGQLSPVLAKIRFLAVTGSIDAEVRAENATAIGSGAQALKAGSVALGKGAVSESAGDIAIGQTATAQGSPDGPAVYAGVAIGDSSLSIYDSVALGSKANSLDRGAIAIGTSALGWEPFVTSVGFGAEVRGQGSVALGAQAGCSAPNAVALGAYSIALDADSVSVGNFALKRRVSNVAPGFDENDAVIVGQFQALRLEHEQLKHIAEARYQQLEQQLQQLEARFQKLSSKVEAA